MKDIICWFILYTLISLFEIHAAEKINTIELNGKVFNLQEIMQLALNSSIEIKKDDLDYEMSDTAFLRGQKKYAPTINFNNSYYNKKDPFSDSSFLIKDYYSWNSGISIRKSTHYGTTMELGMTETYSNVYDSSSHSTSFFMRVEQELLKNAFGFIDKRKDQIYLNHTEVAKRQLRFNISRKIVSILSNYWQITIYREALLNAKIELKSTEQVRNIIKRNTKLGRAQNFDLNQYNALVLKVKSKLEFVEQNLSESKRRFLRKINLSENTNISGVAGFSEKVLKLDEEKMLEQAYNSRADYNNVKLEIRSAKLSVQINKNNSLPSLTGGISLSNNSQHPQFGSAFSNLSSRKYPEYRVTMNLNIPLWDKEIKVNVRNSRINLNKAQLSLRELHTNIRFEILNKIDRVKLTYRDLGRTRKIRKETESYYNKLLNYTQQGKFDAISVKNALDNRTKTRQSELAALVQYNIAILKLDLATNQIFEKYEIDVERLLVPQHSI